MRRAADPPAALSAQDLPASTGAPDWMAQALCAQVDPELWFPDKGGSPRQAKQICARCGVRPECLAYALAQEERFGVWGGQSERARRKLKTRPAERAEDPRAGRVRSLVAAGRSNIEIAAVLGCSDQTVGRLCRAAGLPSDRRGPRSRAGGPTQPAGNNRPDPDPDTVSSCLRGVCAGGGGW